MALLKEEDILKAGSVEAALKEKRQQAAEYLEKTGSLPPWWEIDISIFTDKGAARRKYASPDEYISKGFEYFMKCEENGVHPTRSGLCLYMGFSSWYAFNGFARRFPEFREAHGALLLMLQKTIEEGLHDPKGQSGRKFILTNINDGLEPTDSVDTPLRYQWKEKQQTELVGADGGPIEVSRAVPPEEAYLTMLEGGRLEDPVHKEFGDVQASEIPPPPREHGPIQGGRNQKKPGQSALEMREAVREKLKNE